MKNHKIPWQETRNRFAKRRRKRLSPTVPQNFRLR